MAMSWRWICRDLRKKRFRISLEDGNLTIQRMRRDWMRTRRRKRPVRYIRRERYAGSCARSFYVGDDITEEDIKAEFKHGILKIVCSEERSKTGSRAEKIYCD